MFTPREDWNLNMGLQSPFGVLAFRNSNVCSISVKTESENGVVNQTLKWAFEGFRYQVGWVAYKPKSKASIPGTLQGAIYLPNKQWSYPTDHFYQ